MFGWVVVICIVLVPLESCSSAFLASRLRHNRTGWEGHPRVFLKDMLKLRVRGTALNEGRKPCRKEDGSLAAKTMEAAWKKSMLLQCIVCIKPYSWGCG